MLIVRWKEKLTFEGNFDLKKKQCVDKFWPQNPIFWGNFDFKNKILTNFYVE